MLKWRAFFYGTVLICTIVTLITCYKWLLSDATPAVEKEVTGIQTDSKKRLLFMVASYSFDQYLSLQRTMDCMRDLCNAGWEVTIHLQVSTNALKEEHTQWGLLKERMFCIRTQTYIPLILDHYEMIGFGLNSKHRAYAAAHLEQFDYISYAEEDMLLTVSHLEAYVAGMARLRVELPGEAWLRYQIGFLRYEDSIVGSTDRVTWEYMPGQIHIVDMGKRLGKYIFTNNVNQAIYIFSVEQLRDMEHRCEFLSKPGQNPFYRELRRAQNLEWKYLSVGVSEWSSSFQQVLQCGLRRIVPAQHFQLYMIHHSTNKAQKRRLRKELLTMQNWTELVAEKSLHPISIQEAQGHILREQYNLHLMDTARIQGKAKWSWD